MFLHWMHFLKGCSFWVVQWSLHCVTLAHPLFLDSPLYSQPLFHIISMVFIAMLFTPNPLPSFGLTLPAAWNATVTRNLSLPFCCDIDTWQVSSTLKFKVFSQTIIVFPGLLTESTEHSPLAYIMLCQRHVKHIDVETQSYLMHCWFSFVWIGNYALPYFREWLDTTHVWVVTVILQNSLILNNMEVGVLKAFKN